MLLAALIRGSSTKCWNPIVIVLIFIIIIRGSSTKCWNPIVIVLIFIIIIIIIILP